jgi:hypothetical protein
MTGGFFWMLPPTTCSPWTVLLMIVVLYLWGAEPYDNVLSPELWAVVIHRWKKHGQWTDAYWAVSCLLVHLWFAWGAAWMATGVDRPIWYHLAIVGFSSSHIARICSYKYMDAAASALEACGITCVVGCLAWSVSVRDNWPVLVWLAVAAAERCTHLPAAIKGDAAWMRSYDLWLEAQACCATVDCDDEQDPEAVLAADGTACIALSAAARKQKHGAQDAYV